MREIPVYHKGFLVTSAQVSDEDYEVLSLYRWRLGSQQRYAIRSNHSGNYLPMHRMVCGLLPGDTRQVDHINGHKLDNRRSNLRVVPSIAENSQNLRSKPGSSSQFRGVTWNRNCSKWQATVVLAGKMHYLGLFIDESEAAAVASTFRWEHMPFSIERREQAAAQ